MDETTSDLQFPHRRTVLDALRRSRNSAQTRLEELGDRAPKQLAYYVRDFDAQIAMVESWGDKSAAELIREGVIER